MAPKDGIHKHHCLSIHLPPSCCLLYIACNLPPDRKIYHTNGKYICPRAFFLIITLKYSNITNKIYTYFKKHFLAMSVPTFC